MKNFLNIIFASYKRDLHNYTSYQLNFIGEIFTNFFIVLMLFYISSIFKGTSSVFLEDYGNNYFLFLLTGVMVLSMLSRTFTSLAAFVTTSQSLGYLESLISTKTNFGVVLFGSAIFPLTQSILRIILISIFSVLYDPGILNIFEIILIIFILIISALPFIGISFIIISVQIIYKKAIFLNTSFILGCSIFSGIFFPIDVLPKEVSFLTYVFPTTFSVDLIRDIIFTKSSLLQQAIKLAFIMIIGIIFIVIGYTLMKYSIKKAKCDGSIGHY